MTIMVWQYLLTNLWTKLFAPTCPPKTGFLWIQTVKYFDGFDGTITHLHTLHTRFPIVNVSLWLFTRHIKKLIQKILKIENVYLLICSFQSKKYITYNMLWLGCTQWRITTIINYITIYAKKNVQYLFKNKLPALMWQN